MSALHACACSRYLRQRSQLEYSGLGKTPLTASTARTAHWRCVSSSIFSLSTFCTRRWIESVLLSGSRCTSEYLSNSLIAALNLDGSAAIGSSVGPRSAALSANSSSGMASGAKKAQKRNSSAAAALACSTFLKESDQVVARGSG